MQQCPLGLGDKITKSDNGYGNPSTLHVHPVTTSIINYFVTIVISSNTHSYFRISSYFLFAFFTSMSKDIFITADAIWLLFFQDVALPGQGVVTLGTREVTTMPILLHGFCVLSSKDQLQDKRKDANEFLSLDVLVESLF